MHKDWDQTVRATPLLIPTRAAGLRCRRRICRKSRGGQLGCARGCLPWAFRSRKLRSKSNAAQVFNEKIWYPSHGDYKSPQITVRAHHAPPRHAGSESGATRDVFPSFFPFLLDCAALPLSFDGCCFLAAVRWAANVALGGCVSRESPGLRCADRTAQPGGLCLRCA